ncbi:DUF4091 domain-containing protein [Pseudalkalibacillus decolorationis]|uniref:DUF4091 domain-containing protein n=1 Tax=Pseudalkalibacillus decolorationis TaxID=163879 RepID=UPI0021493188|nr:DUF4091 domain-containing protein [Pseudalkalibacillus decolorationis]
MINNGQELETRCLSSLVKVFADEELQEPASKRGSALLNEVYSFQVAYRNDGTILSSIKVSAETDFQESLSIRSVGLIPCELPCYHDPDDNILRSTPGLYPDPLYPLDDNGITGLPNQWRSVWITVNVSEKMKPGVHTIKINFETDAGKSLAQETFELEVIPEKLPEQKLIHTEWFHTDCIAVQYDVDIFSEEHWSLIERYVQTAAEHGINMILTPLFTPPLDTEVGRERPTVQLIDVEKVGENYYFSFDKLIRWVDLCTEKGIKYFEFAHFFTQWGAEHAPKIVATENGDVKKIFGWETDAAGEDYKLFLSQFFPELIMFIEEQDLENRVYFHISDEPSLNQLDSYQQASEIIYRYLSKFPIIDALSDFQFYEKGIIRNPIPANNHIEPFIENQVPNLWTYYCCSQYKHVSNRFINFPSARNRIIGMQLYKFNIEGFLHWGYNFWFSQFSRRQIDPFRNTDAGYAFPSGDPFLVYPGKDGPIESIRMEVFFEALQDLRALQLLEKLIGKNEVIELLEDKLDQPISFSKYPCDSEWLLEIREEVNRRIAEESVNK